LTWADRLTLLAGVLGLFWCHGKGRGERREPGESVRPTPPCLRLTGYRCYDPADELLGGVP
jgi:hypothetical protein